MDAKMSERQEIPNEYRQVTTKANCMEILHNAVLPRCVIGFFKVEKDSHNVLLFKEGIPYEGLHANQMVEGAAASSEATLDKWCPDSSSQMRRVKCWTTEESSPLHLILLIIVQTLPNGVPMVMPEMNRLQHHLHASLIVL